MRTRVALLAIVASAGACLTAALGPAGASGLAVGSSHGSSVTTCGFIHASVPYSSRGAGQRWRVYVTGAASCASAVAVLDAVMHLHATPHVGGSEADSYFTYNRWSCPFGNMGQQSCELPARPPAHPPIRAHALALDCTTAGRGCPARVPTRDL
jgi:hypothetical protein